MDIQLYILNLLANIQDIFFYDCFQTFCSAVLRKRPCHCRIPAGIVYVYVYDFIQNSGYRVWTYSYTYLIYWLIFRNISTIYSTETHYDN